MNIEDKRDEIRRQKNKPWYVKCPWFEKELLKALEKVDMLEREQGKVRSELRKWQVETIEQRIREAIKTRIISSFAGHDIHSLDPVNVTIDEILEAVDSVGGTDG